MVVGVARCSWPQPTSPPAWVDRPLQDCITRSVRAWTVSGVEVGAARCPRKQNPVRRASPTGPQRAAGASPIESDNEAEILHRCPEGALAEIIEPRHQHRLPVLGRA